MPPEENRGVPGAVRVWLKPVPLLIDQENVFIASLYCFRILKNDFEETSPYAPRLRRVPGGVTFVRQDGGGQGLGAGRVRVRGAQPPGLR